MARIMILDEIVLHDFGIYAGQQTIELTPPSPDKSITMFYGLNGCGKTTILEALQIALFGQQAPFLEGENYSRYMEQRINKKSRHRQASLRLDFHRNEDGQIVRYRIYRIWKKTLSGIKESLEVIKDGHASKSLSSGWSQYVEEIISARLAHFFFFDGEKIGEYASEEGAQQLIKTGLYNLLGLDLLGKSEQDLMVLKKRKLSESQSQSSDDGIKQDIKKKKIELSQLEDRKKELLTERTSINTHEVDAYQRKLDDLNKEYKRLGGDLWKRREEIKTAIFNAKAEKDANNNLIREALYGSLPLFLVRQHFAALDEFKAASLSGRMEKIRYDALQDRDQQVLSFLQKSTTDKTIITKLTDYLDSSRSQLVPKKETFSPFSESKELDDFDRATLETELQESADMFAQYLKAGYAIDEKIDDLIAEEASVPDGGDMKSLTEQIVQMESKLTQSKISLEKMDTELDASKNDIKRLQSEIEGLQRKILEMDMESRRTEKYINRIDVAGDVLKSFSRKILNSKVKHIEQLITESYELLLRKKNLISEVSIDPGTLNVLLNTTDNDSLANSQLSAGEQQLLSISILWGLAKASSQPFPVAVDTPFGRLDSEHRKKLVSNYLPRASHQVMLFSTDEEIVGEYFEIIKPYVGKIYRLNYDNQHQRTEVTTEHVSA